MDNVELFGAIYERAKKELIPKLCVGPKRSFAIHKLINFILNLVYPKDRKDAYLKEYNTTIGFSIAMAEYVGDNSESFGNWRTLCHEIKHAQQAKKWTRILFGALYLFPISLGVALLLVGWVGAIWMPGWWKAVYLVSWLAVTATMFIPQLPDPWRKRWEFQAYAISMHLRSVVHSTIDPEYVESLVKNFHSMMYYIMAPNEEKIRKELNALRVQILMGRSPVKNEPIIRIAEEEYRKRSDRS